MPMRFGDLNTRPLKILPLASLTGFLVGCGVLSFHELVHFFQKSFFPALPEKFPLHIFLRDLPGWKLFLIPLLGGVMVGLIRKWVGKENVSEAVPMLIRQLLLRGGEIPKRATLSLPVCASITISTGGSVGSEGPMAFMGGGIGSLIGKIFKLKENGVKTLLASGCAAAIAAAFNAPLGGTLFAAEVILGDFAMSSLSPIVISAVTGTALARVYRGDLPDFLVPRYTLLYNSELVFYLLLGGFCGLFAISFIKTFFALENFWGTFHFGDFVSPVLGGALIGILVNIFPQLYGTGYFATSENLTGHNQMGLFILLALVSCKVLATSLTICSGGVGGIFAPSLFIGSTLGLIFFQLLQFFVQGWGLQSGAYSLVGMAAFFSGVTHAPIAAIMIIFEITGDYHIILPLLLACIASSVMVQVFIKDSFYTVKLRAEGILKEKDNDLEILNSIPVKRNYHKKFQLFQMEDDLKTMFHKSMHSHWSTFPVVDNQNKYLGFIHQDQLKVAFEENEELNTPIIAKDLIENRLFLTLDSSMHEAEEIFFENNLIQEIPILKNRETEEVAGIFTQVDLIHTLHKEVEKRRLACAILERMNIEEKQNINYLKISDDLFLEEVPIKPGMINRSILHLQFRKKYHLEIILVRKNLISGIKDTPVSASYVIRPEDSLVVIGRKIRIERYLEYFVPSDSQKDLRKNPQLTNLIADN